MAGELILIVEDNEKNRKLERDVLQAKGYRTIEAETGEDAVRLAGERLPALVLMDIQLPGIDGIAALRQLRADSVTRAIPVIAVTASVMTHDRQKIMAAGFDGYQPKPIRVKEFLEAVRDARAEVTMSAKILVVDDTPQNVKLLADLLTAKGYAVVRASSGVQALEKVEKETPDLVL